MVLEQAQQQYDKVKDVPGVGMLPQSLQLQQATIGYETAQANYRVTSRGADQAQLAASQAQIAQAQAALDRVQRGPTKEQVDVAQAAVDQAQLAVEQAQRRLENTRLVAPWNGIVTSVAAVEGALAQPGVPALQLADQSQFHINVQVDEVDVAERGARSAGEHRVGCPARAKMGGPCAHDRARGDGGSGRHDLLRGHHSLRPDGYAGARPG